MVNQHETLETKSLADFISRMQRGTIFYIFAWFTPAIIFEFYSIYPAFFIGTSIFCIATTIFRIYVCRIVNADAYTKTNQKKKLAIAAVSSSAILWGGMYAFILGHNNLENSLLGITVITGMIAASATALLSIYKLASLLTQLFLLIPGVLVIIYQNLFTHGYNETNVFLGAALTVSFIYLRQVSKTAGSDYMNATKNQLLAENRAQEMELLSIRDPLTKLKNRLFFDSYLEEAWLEAQANNTMISLIMIDLDHFKRINDTYGHLFGDECLKIVANTLKKNLRQEGDHLARFGGEEFILCLHPSTPQRALIIADRLLKSIRKTEVPLNGGKIKLTCSIGLTSINAIDLEDVDELLLQTDEALYDAKKSGRDQISVNTPKENSLNQKVHTL